MRSSSAPTSPSPGPTTPPSSRTSPSPWAAAALIVAIHLVFQQIDLNILIPRLVGRRVRLHPIVVIIGVLSGAAVAGVLGVVLAAPVIASARVIGAYLKANLYDEDPFPLAKPVPAEPAPAARAG
jgi:predicted PurR-regulated permease PerM